MDFNGKKVAVARFSRPGMNWVSGSIVPLKVGKHGETRGRDRGRNRGLGVRD